MRRLTGILPHPPWPGLRLRLVPGSDKSLAWLVSSSAGALLVLCSGAGITYAVQLVTARTVGPEGYGIYAYVVAWVSLAAYVSTLGFHTSLLRLLPAYEAHGQWPFARGCLRFASIMTITISSLLALGIYLGADMLASGDRAMRGALWVASAAVPLVALQLVVSAGARAFGGPVIALLPERIVRDAVTLGFLGTAIIIGYKRLDVTLVVVAFVTGCTAALAAAIMALRFLHPVQLLDQPARYDPLGWLKPTVPMTVILVADNILARAAILVLGLLANIQQVGLFAMALSLSLLTALPRMAIASAFAPRVSALHALGDVNGLREISARSSLLSLAGTIMIALALSLVAPTLFGWIGPSFVAATPLFLILVSGQIFAAGFGPQQHFLTMTGHEGASATIFVASAVIMIVACLALVPAFGTVGAALATVCFTVVFNCGMARMIWSRLGLPPGVVITFGSTLGRKRTTMLTEGLRAGAHSSNDDAICINPTIQTLLEGLETRNLRYCHWKSNKRLQEALSGNDDVDLLIDRRDLVRFHALLTELGFKLAVSRAGIGHPGVFHAFALDAENVRLLHIHAYSQVVTGDSLVKAYRFPIEDELLANTRYLHGTRVPSSEAELVLFALRIALKHTQLVEIALVARDYPCVIEELGWLRDRSSVDAAAVLCESWFPSIDKRLFYSVLEALGSRGTLWRRIFVGYRVAAALKGYRRIGSASASIERARRVFALALARLQRRRDLSLAAGGAIVALTGPKAVGKSTLGFELAARLGEHLDVERIHVGKPPATFVTWPFHAAIPLARRIFPRERPGEYEKPERRSEQTPSLLYILRMMVLAYDRRSLLRRALRSATGGTIVICDRFPSSTPGAMDSVQFAGETQQIIASRLKRKLMRIEERLCRDVIPATLVVRLLAPLTTSLRRDQERTKEGGPDAAAVKRRRLLETKGEFQRSSVIQIDTDRTIETTVREVVGSVWDHL